MYICCAPCKDLLAYFLKQDTLVRYLLDELYLSEDDHSDALCPIQREAQVSLLGEHALVRPPTTEEVRLLHSELKFDVKHIEAEVGAMKQSFNLFASALNNFANSPSCRSIFTTARLFRCLLYYIKMLQTGQLLFPSYKLRNQCQPLPR